VNTNKVPPAAKLRFQKQLPSAQAATEFQDLVNTRYKVFLTIPDMGVRERYLGYITEKPGKSKTLHLAFLAHEQGKSRYVGTSWSTAIDTLAYHLANNILGLLITSTHGKPGKYTIVELTNPLELKDRGYSQCLNYKT